jgi:hypothetical protein
MTKLDGHVELVVLAVCIMRLLGTTQNVITVSSFMNSFAYIDINWNLNFVVL